MQLDKQKQFSDVVHLIKHSRNNAIKAVNTELIDLYWNIGQYISKQIESAAWGDSVVKELADLFISDRARIKRIFR